MPHCMAAQNDVERLSEYLGFVNNRLPGGSGLEEAKNLVKTAAEYMKQNIDSYITAPVEIRCCHPHFADFESQIRGLQWPPLADLNAISDDLIYAIKQGYQKALNDHIHC